MYNKHVIIVLLLIVIFVFRKINVINVANVYVKIAKPAICKEQYCDLCILECENCFAKSCFNCGYIENCDKCNRKLCNKCMNEDDGSIFCSECANGFYCDDCLYDGKCPSCII